MENLERNGGCHVMAGNKRILIADIDDVQNVELTDFNTKSVTMKPGRAFAEIKAKSIRTEVTEDGGAYTHETVCLLAGAKRKYDRLLALDAEFAKTGSGRDAMVKKLVSDIAIYYCYESSSPVNMPETRENAYKSAIEFLKSVQAEHAALPGLVRLNGSKGSNYVKHGGNRKRRNKWL